MGASPLGSGELLVQSRVCSLVAGVGSKKLAPTWVDTIKAPYSRSLALRAERARTFDH